MSAVDGTSSDSPLPESPLTGGWLWLAAVVLAAGNFVAILDMTIANVSVSTIAGGLGASTSQGTWVITSYSVAEAITVPLTGWLVARFGAVRVFVVAMAMFGLCSALCGLANSLGMLVLARVAQGLVGGPLMPMSQTLLLRIFPKEKAAAAMGLWAVTTLVAPVFGPILGGVICDDMSWPWIFMINVPLALACAIFAWRLLARYRDVLVRAPIDVVGLGLLVVWVAALQIMLDEGKDLEWFASWEIRALAVTAVVGFVAFLIWESTEAHPAVDLRVFRHRGFTMGTLTLVLTFGGIFAVNVTTPLWLQTYMGYTATWSGRTLAWSGVSAIIVAPIAATLSTKFDPRALVFCGVSWIAGTTLFRTFADTDMTYWHIALPILALGFGMPMFFVPLTGFVLGSVEEAETASAAGLMNFLRTLAGAVATSMVNTAWEDGIKSARADLVAIADRTGETFASYVQTFGTSDMARAALERLIEPQAAMLATNRMLSIIAGVVALAALSVWLAPRPTRQADISQAH